MSNKLSLLIAVIALTFNSQLSTFNSAAAQGWPSAYGGVMLQGFYWDSYTYTAWSYLESQADELSQYFDLIWVPQSGNCNVTSNSMGYMPVYYFDQNSSFGSESQLRSMISTYKALGTGIIADVVINHRNVLGENSSWVDFPSETYNGVTYQMQSTDICADDDDGATATWAASNGYSLSDNDDTGEDWSGCRDLDHASTNVQTCVNAYLDYLLNDLGYAGFRYDMTKGYDAAYTGLYNSTANPTYSVGEYWDGNSSTLVTWLDGTKVNDEIQSAAFDFAFRYKVQDAIDGTSDWSGLKDRGLAGTDGYSRYAVTFVENHDTEYRSSSEPQDPIYSDTLAANAFLIGTPGTPCVFYKHWLDYKQEIKAMIDARKACGITNESSCATYGSSSTYIADKVNGTTGNLMVVVGSGASNYSLPTAFIEILTGYHYRYAVQKTAEIAWADKASGEYSEAFDVTLIAVSSDTDAKLVYTLDGTDPTTSSTTVESGTSVTISDDCTLKVGLLSGGTVSGIITREYTITPFEAHTATIYLKDPSWDNVYFYAWDDDGELLGSWPGTLTTQTTTISDVTWYYQTFNIDEEGYTFNIIFDQGSGKYQTVDIGPLSEDTYYEIGSLSSGKYTVNDVTSEYATAIAAIIGTDSNRALTDAVNIYSIDGRKVATVSDTSSSAVTSQLNALPAGVYIVNGKKVVR